MSIFFLMLCSFILCICFLNSWFLRYKLNFFNFLLWITFFFLANVFLSLDFFIFFCFFELILIPMYFFIVFGGVAVEKYMLLISFLFIL